MTTVPTPFRAAVLTVSDRCSRGEATDTSGPACEALLRDRLGATIAGETAKVSQQQLEELDYERLLGQADLARREAEKRLEELRKLQEQQPAGRRGKW